MSIITKPMLAGTAKDLGKLIYPLLGTPKLDGIRCLKLNGKALSRKFKDIPNESIRHQIQANCPDGFDGEIICPDKTFNETQSLVMSEEGCPEFEFHVFDWVVGDTDAALEIPYTIRMEVLECEKAASFVHKVLPTLIHNEEELLAFEEKCLAEGYEGVMLRKPDGPYKCGRSTEKEQFLLKRKPFEDSEAEVIGFTEQFTNTNEAVKDAQGHTKRSSSKAGLVPAGTLGNLLVRDINHGWEFEIGTGIGLTKEFKHEIWNNQDRYTGKIVTYKFQRIGMKDKPRIPSFRGFRDPRDMGGE